MKRASSVIAIGLLVVACSQGAECSEVRSLWDDAMETRDETREEMSSDRKELEGEALQLIIDVSTSIIHRAQVQMAVLAEQHPACFTLEERLNAETDFRMSLYNKIDRAVFRIRN